MKKKNWKVGDICTCAHMVPGNCVVVQTEQDTNESRMTAGKIRVRTPEGFHLYLFPFELRAVK